MLQQTQVGPDFGLTSSYAPPHATPPPGRPARPRRPPPPPDAAFYAALLNGYAHVPDPRAAQKLLDEMPHGRVAPSSLARTFLVKALLRSRDVHGAMDDFLSPVAPPESD